MVKYITPLLYIGSSESDSKIYINFEFCEEIGHKHLKSTLVYKSKQFMLINFFARKVYILLFEDGASSLQVDILNK
jgi:hypothetical protein